MPPQAVFSEVLKRDQNVAPATLVHADLME